MTPLCAGYIAEIKRQQSNYPNAVFKQYKIANVSAVMTLHLMCSKTHELQML
ncbi:hypothetical protein GPUN_0112 [Glaciecola punicea ACAM 611]|uniref:Uncharacterized protein n=1 Tax=Glaciecola punicea ACAM 611 TaxID=1121923 RepID=H5T7I9_9ALTE|nr:hypothetical protein GPUN_0112 [Glaciecola punicea ACAM 611]